VTSTSSSTPGRRVVPHRDDSGPGWRGPFGSRNGSHGRRAWPRARYGMREPCAGSHSPCQRSLLLRGQRDVPSQQPLDTGRRAGIVAFGQRLRKQRARRGDGRSPARCRAAVAVTDKTGQMAGHNRRCLPPRLTTPRPWGPRLLTPAGDPGRLQVLRDRRVTHGAAALACSRQASRPSDRYHLVHQEKILRPRVEASRPAPTNGCRRPPWLPGQEEHR
jgi:hypothetical protein